MRGALCVVMCSSGFSCMGVHFHTWRNWLFLWYFVDALFCLFVCVCVCVCVYFSIWHKWPSFIIHVRACIHFMFWPGWPNFITVCKIVCIHFNRDRTDRFDGDYYCTIWAELMNFGTEVTWHTRALYVECCLYVNRALEVCYGTDLTSF